MAASSARYQNTGPVDCSTPVDTSNLSGKTAIITGGKVDIRLAMQGPGNLDLD